MSGMAAHIVRASSRARQNVGKYYVVPRKGFPLPNLTPEEIQEFWLTVDIQGVDDCWLWQGTNSGIRAGQFVFANYTSYGAARIAYFLATGHDPQGFKICYPCDALLCVNPAHLRIERVYDD